MADSFTGEVRMFAGTFAPDGWAMCHGQLLQIVDYGDLFGLIGTTYGGDGQTTFALPDLRGRAPLHHDANYPTGAWGGAEEVTLGLQQMPVHNHPLIVAGDNGTQSSPAGNAPGAVTAPLIYRAGTPSAALDPSALPGVAGGSQPHTNLQPYLVVNFIISLEGIVPS